LSLDFRKIARSSFIQKQRNKKETTRGFTELNGQNAVDLVPCQRTKRRWLSALEIYFSCPAPVVSFEQRNIGLRSAFSQVGNLQYLFRIFQLGGLAFFSRIPASLGACLALLGH
jgi:hypothetical protein